MPVARRSRTIGAPAEEVWAVVADPHHIPRWWPGVKRVEAVEDDRFTQVLTTKKGRPVRMDFRVVTREAPGEQGGRAVWEQEIEGTPFARVLGESITEIALEPADAGTVVTVALTQRLRGYSRTGGFLLRRASRAKLDEALDGLEQILTAP
jgi:carbon monoxide dehydrogenase subunit G